MRLVSIVCITALFGLSAACSSDDDGGGGSGASGGSGGSGASGGSSGSSSGGSAGSGAGGGAGTGTGGSAGGDGGGGDACLTCIESMCSAALGTCQADNDCTLILACAQQCTGGANCVDNCALTHPLGKSAWDPLAACVGSNCSSVCN